MTRAFKSYGGEDLSPEVDLTERLIWEEVEFGTKAYMGEGVSSSFGLRDELGDLSASGATYNIGTRNMMEITLDGQRLWRGRRGPMSSDRRIERADRARVHTVNADDANHELRGIIVDAWVRPAETDVARVQALGAAFLAGSPRATTDLDVTTWVPNTNTVALPAHTYNQMDPYGVLQEIAGQASKNFWVTIDDELFYDTHISTAYATTISISDDPDDAGGGGGEGSDALCYHPIWNVGPPVEFDGTNFMSGARMYWGAGAAEYVEHYDSSQANLNAYWATILQDSNSQSEEEAQRRVEAILARRYQGITYNVTIGPMGDDHAKLLKPGHLIDIKARVIGAGNDFIARRVSQLKWTTPVPGTWFAHMVLDTPHRVLGTGIPRGPSPATATDPGTPATGGTPVYHWGFEGVNTEDGGFFPAPTPAFGQFAGGFLEADGFDTGGIHLTAPFPPLAESVAYTFTAVVRNDSADGPIGISLQWYDDNSGSTLLQSDYFGAVNGGPSTISGTFTAPAGSGANVYLRWDVQRPSFGAHNNLAIGDFSVSTGGTPAVPATDPLHGTETDCYALCDHKHTEGMDRPPTVDDDEDAGYPTGTFWLDQATGIVYVLRDSTTGSADWVPVGSGTTSGSADWIDVTAYGAAGDGTTDDTSDINDAIAALNNAGAGVLYFPAGNYLVSSALTPITVPCTIMGDGSRTWGAFTAAAHASTITCSSGTAVLMEINSRQATVKDLGFVNSGTPSAGCAIEVSDSDAMQRVNFENVTVDKFYDGIDVQTGTAWVMDSCVFRAQVRYGVRIRNTVNNDFGDWTINACGFWGDTGDAGVRIESAGGGKLTNNKWNVNNITGWDHGIDLAISGSTQSSVFLVANNSFENVTGDGIHVTTATGSSHYRYMTFVGNQFGIYGNNTGKAISLVAADAGDLSDIAIANNIFVTDGTARSAVQLTNCDNVTLVGNVLSANFTSLYTNTTSTDVVEIGGSGSSDLDDLTDVAITAPATGDMLRYDGANFVNTPGRWEPVTTNPGGGPELVWDGDELLMTWVNT